MGIQPIDLQTLFTQLDKVGKTQFQQTQAAQLQNAMIHDEISRKQAAQKEAVEKTSDIEDELEVRENDENASSGGQKQKKKDNSENLVQEKEKEYFSDPGLGQHIDISG